MLDRLPPSYQTAVLNIIYCILQYIDISTVSPTVLNADVLRVVSKHIHVSMPLLRRLVCVCRRLAGVRRRRYSNWL